MKNVRKTYEIVHFFFFFYVFFLLSHDMRSVLVMHVILAYYICECRENKVELVKAISRFICKSFKHLKQVREIMLTFNLIINLHEWMLYDLIQSNNKVG